MKLIYCNNCGDVVRLIHLKWRKCACGQSGGQYNEDLITATVGGNCRIFGIPNPFFDEVFQYLTDKGKQWYRDKNGPYGSTDAWYGETPGDKQIFRIDSANGPKLKLKIKKISNSINRIYILDKRNYIIDGDKSEYIETERVVIPSFKLKKMKEMYK